MNAKNKNIPFIGLTGGIASGKTVVSAIFSSLGVVVIDTDIIGQELLQSGNRAIKIIKRDFGDECMNSDGSIDRSALRSIVFSDEGLRKRLETILHPLIEKECRRLMKLSNGIYGILVAPLLFEVNFMLDELDRVLLIDIDQETQTTRGIERGNFSEQQLLAAIDGQLTQQERRQRADDIIDNSGSSEELTKKISEQHTRYIELYSK